MQKKFLSAFVFGAFALASPVLAAGHPPSGVERAFLAAKQDGLNSLTAFFTAFPKGADLHNHLSGAIYAESYVRWAQSSGLCVDAATLTLDRPPCTAAKPAVADYLQQPGNTANLLNAFSMRDGPVGGVAGHDHFFASFGKFNTAATVGFDNGLAELALRADRENLRHLELMLGIDGKDVQAIAGKLHWRDDFSAMKAEAEALGLDAAVARARDYIDAREITARALLGCPHDAQAPGCGVDIGFIPHLNRTAAPATVFVEALIGTALARTDPHILGLNIVAPEDNPTALRDYALHMRILAFAASDGAPVHLALHAGELTPRLAPPEDLQNHIRQAVEIGHAERIGHGSDIAFETDSRQLLAEMRAKRIAVELALTSNEQILGLDAQTSPFRLYRRAGVPIVLATDDAGVERTTLSLEYAKAAAWFDLSYADAKALSIASLRYSFVPGADLWRDADATLRAAPCAHDAPPKPASAACQSFLAANRRAALEWDLLGRFAVFEQGYGR
jgi:adenosine deaminase